MEFAPASAGDRHVIPHEVARPARAEAHRAKGPLRVTVRAFEHDLVRAAAEAHALERVVRRVALVERADEAATRLLRQDVAAVGANAGRETEVRSAHAVADQAAAWCETRADVSTVPVV